VRYEYCREWDTASRTPLEPLSEMEARQRFEGQVPEPDHWFSVAALRDDSRPDSVPDFTLEVLPHAEFVNVAFLDEFASERFNYGLTRIDDRLFMSHVTEHRYPDDGRHHGLHEATFVEEFLFRPDGYVKRVVMDESDSMTHASEYRDVDVAQHWQEVPGFGDWEPLGVFSR